MSKAVFPWVFSILFLAVMSGQSMDITIEWEPASTTVDGELLDHVHCYKVFYSDTSGVYSNFVEVTDTRAVLSGLEYNRTFYFSVKTCTSAAESDFSDELVWTAPVMADEDADGISDDWEMAYFGDLSAADSITDSDNNGVCDQIEFIAGTNPMDSLDSPLLVSLGQGTIAFEARAVAGDGYQNRARTYSLQYCEDLALANWTPVSGMEQIFAEGQVVQYDVPDNTTHGFYRTEIQLN